MNDRKRAVAEAYDHIAEGYLAWRRTLFRERDLAYFARLTEELELGARVLDAGCGAGEPFTQELAKRFDAVGVDISARQLALARGYVPEADLLQADLGALPFHDGSFAAVTAMYSIIHVPREEHARVFASLYALLRPGGRLLAVVSCSAWEGTEENWLGLGRTMWWSHYDARTNRSLVERAGFRILHTAVEIDDDEDSYFLFVVAEKPA